MTAPLRVNTDQCAEWVRAAQRGDRAAFAELYATHARMVHGVLLARLPAGEVEDLVQEVFMQAMERLHTLRDARAFGGWLAVMARNRATDHLRRAMRTEDLGRDVAANDPDRSEIVELLAAIRALPMAYRETLTLRFAEGMTGPEIAARTGLTPGSVRVNLHRGIRQLRERLERTRA